MITFTLDKLLKQRGLTQTQLSQMANVRQERISRLCRGYVDRVEIEHIDRICNALDVEPWEWIVWSKIKVSDVGKKLLSGESHTWEPDDTK